jgi:hypothetical protein
VLTLKREVAHKKSDEQIGALAAASVAAALTERRYNQSLFGHLMHGSTPRSLTVRLWPNAGLF